ncbi:MAG: SDR family oxidoreductase [Clostridia bacterium]|nr:SDR family oxidoreductase [Clostridia bacterium]
MGKRALITGASKGIGEELAKIYAKNGYDLILVARDYEKLNVIKNNLEGAFNVDVKVISMDLTLPSSSEVLFNSLRHNRVDVLINNAGMGSYGEFHKSDLKKEEDLIMLNVLSLMKLSFLYSNMMVENGGGTIINIASTASFQAGPLMSNYYASKAYVLSFTEAISKELKKNNVKVIAYCPGPTKTGFLETANVSKEDLDKENMMSPKLVAQDIYDKSIKSNKSVIIQGKKFKLALFFERFISRRTATNFVYNIQKKRTKAENENETKTENDDDIYKLNL